MADEEARCIAEYLIVRRGPAAYVTALGHADRLKATGQPHFATFWTDIAAEVAVMEAYANEAAAVSLRAR